MKAITLWQPWATLIAAGLKTIETRTHNHFACLVEQRIAIHGGRHFDEDAEEAAIIAARSFRGDKDGRLKDMICRAVQIARRQLGMIVCTAFVRMSRSLTAADAGDALCEIEDNRFGLLLSEVEPCLYLASGHQGIWEWDPATMAAPADPQTSLLPATDPCRSQCIGEHCSAPGDKDCHIRQEMVANHNSAPDGKG